MKFTRADRSLIAWTLYFSVLFNLFACGIGHGQMMGLQLNGIGGAFCSAMGTPGPTLKTDYSDASIAGWDSLQTCPVCAAAVVCLALSLVIGCCWRSPARAATTANCAARRHLATAGPRPTRAPPPCWPDPTRQPCRCPYRHTPAPLRGGAVGSPAEFAQ